MDKDFRNVLIMSVGIMLMNGAYFTTAAISQVILESARVEDPSIVVDGYVSLGIFYTIFALSNLVTTSVVKFMGVRTTLVLGTVVFTLYSASFLYPNVWLLYGASSLMGFVGASFYVAHGSYLTKCCTKDNIGKYFGIYMAIMSLGQLSGSLFIFWMFEGSNHIDKDTRIIVVAVLTSIGFLSTVTLMFLGPPGEGKEQTEKEVVSKKKQNACSTFLEPFNLLRNKHMLLLIPACLLNGVEQSYFESILPTTIGFTESYGGDVRKWVGLTGVLTALGVMCSGVVFGAFGEKLVKSNRSVIVSISSGSLLLTALLLYLNHPNSSSYGPTMDVSWINPPLVPVSLLCAFLIGLGDGCVNTQINAAIGVIWPDNPYPAMAVFRMNQGLACAFALFLGTLSGLVNHLILLVIVALIGAVTFNLNEKLIHKESYSLDGVSNHSDYSKNSKTCSVVVSNDSNELYSAPPGKH